MKYLGKEIELAKSKSKNHCDKCVAFKNKIGEIGICNGTLKMSDICNERKNRTKHWELKENANNQENENNRFI